MNPVLFQRNGLVLDGTPVPGHYVWPVAVRLSGVLLVCQPPQAGQLTLTLEVDDVPTNVAILVPAGAAKVRRSFAIDHPVPAGKWVRWRAQFEGLAESAATNVQITLHVVPAGAAAESSLQLRWVEGSPMTLFRCDPGSGTFSETAPGVSAGRVNLVQTSERLSLALGAVELFRVKGGAIAVRDLAVGAAVASGPRLEFCLGGRVLAVLDWSAFRVGQLREADPDELLPGDPGYHERFEFRAGGQLVGVLSADGLVVRELLENAPL